MIVCFQSCPQGLPQAAPAASPPPCPHRKGVDKPVDCLGKRLWTTPTWFSEGLRPPVLLPGQTAPAEPPA